MTRCTLLLALLTTWFLAPDMALAAGVSTSQVQYRADGIFGAALAVLTRDLSPPDWSWLWRAICDAAALLWVMHPVCDIYWPTAGIDTASVCDDVSGIPGSAIVVCIIAAAAGWLLDQIRSGRG